MARRVGLFMVAIVATGDTMTETIINIDSKEIHFGNNPNSQFGTQANLGILYWNPKVWLVQGISVTHLAVQVGHQARLKYAYYTPVIGPINCKV
ncbi:MAG: hypothetical protein ACRCZI_15470 [Cetobacterium sp.]